MLGSFRGQGFQGSSENNFKIFIARHLVEDPVAVCGNPSAPRILFYAICQVKGGWSAFNRHFQCIYGTPGSDIKSLSVRRPYKTVRLPRILSVQRYFPVFPVPFIYFLYRYVGKVDISFCIGCGPFRKSES